ncbi:MAG TPA: LysR family transcriptional regulator [Advenella sp.]|nr:LysR family transcriptional regulator [Advenella sp.]
MMTNSDDLLTFVTVIDSGSISAAAEQLNLTPSAVSRTLSRLEQSLETTLLNRTTRRMHLTEEGRFLLEHARIIVARMQAMQETLATRRQSPAGRLRVNAASPFMLHMIVPYIASFRQNYPHIELQLNTHDLNIDLLEQSTDLAIRIGPLQNSTLHARHLGGSALNLLASPDYLARYGTPQTVAELAEHTLLGFTQPDSLNLWPVCHAGTADKVMITPNVAASSGETLRQLALAGQGIVCLSEFMTYADIRDTRLVPILPLLTERHVQPIHAVYYRNSPLALRIQSFIDFMHKTLAAQPWNRR